MKYNDDLCKHGLSWGYCPDRCIKFADIKEQISEDRRLFLKQFKQTPLPLEKLLARKRWCKMNPVTKETFVRKLLQYNKLERIIG